MASWHGAGESGVNLASGEDEEEHEMSDIEKLISKNQADVWNEK